MVAVVKVRLRVTPTQIWLGPHYPRIGQITTPMVTRSSPRDLVYLGGRIDILYLEIITRSEIRILNLWCRGTYNENLGRSDGTTEDYCSCSKFE